MLAIKVWRTIQFVNGGWYCARYGYGGSNEYWPEDATKYVDQGTAITMCDVFNARDYPEIFAVMK